VGSGVPAAEINNPASGETFLKGKIKDYAR
jgi:hypothetical protein